MVVKYIYAVKNFQQTFQYRWYLTSATEEDLEEIKPLIKDFCNEFGKDYDKIINSHFYILIPDTKNPYKQLYTHN